MKNLILISAVLFMSGCSLFQTPEPIKVEIPVESKFTLLPPTQPDAIESKEVEFNVVSRKDFMEAATEKGLSLEDAAKLAEVVFEDDIALFTLNDKTYGNLGENMQEIIRYIRGQRKVIQYYKDNVPEPSPVVKKDTKKKDG